MNNTALVTGTALSLSLGGVQVFADLSFCIGPGLTWVRGGDGRGKTSLLRMLAGKIQPSSGVLLQALAVAEGAESLAAAHDNTVASLWLSEQQASHARWNAALAETLLTAMGLDPHAHKPLYMLSTGSRRKLGLVAAAASGALLTLLDAPYAALDARSCALLDELLTEAAEDRHRAWVVADCAVPAGLVQAPLAGCIDLGD